MQEFFLNLNPYLSTFLLAMMPISELRIAIPLGITLYNLTPLQSYSLSVLGNAFAALCVLVGLHLFFKWGYHKIYIFNRFFAWLFAKTRDKHAKSVEKYGVYLLLFFVAEPFLPFTGAWTGALITFIFGMPPVKSFLFIVLGLIISGLIVLFLTLGGIFVSKYFELQILAAIIIITLIVGFFLKKNGKKLKNISIL